MANKNVNRPSKALIGRLVSSRVVLWALDTHGPQLMDRVADPAETLLATGSSEIFEPLVGHLSALLTEAKSQLTRADRQNRDQVARASMFRRLRNDAAKELAPLVAGLRDAFRGIFGPNAIEDLGFAVRQPERADELFEQAEHLLDRLAAASEELPEARFSSLPVDPASLAAEIRPRVARLGEALEEVTREVRRAEASLLAKDEAVARFDRTFQWAARIAEVSFKLVELHEIAKRVRPSTRRPGITVAVSTGEEPTTIDETVPVPDMPAPEAEPEGTEADPETPVDP